MEKIKIAILGMGTVGTGTWKIIACNGTHIMNNSDFEIEVAKVLVRDPLKDRGVNIPAQILTTDYNEILADDSIKIVVELMGGLHPAKEFIEAALKHKKHVVTANKALLAKHGCELFAAAVKEGRTIKYEASVCGGIPIINTVEECLTANKIEKIMGIVNGTTNYILTEMSAKKSDFSNVLRAAQEKGYAEADPTSDIEGYDAMYKLKILTKLAFRTDVAENDILREGITCITKEDIAYSGELGYALKLLAISRIVDNRLELRVHPTLIPLTHPLANVNDAYNAVYIRGNAVGDLMFYGKGAGDLPTGSAVVSDIISIIKHKLNEPANTEPESENETYKVIAIEEIQSAYFIRFAVKDKPGVLGKIASEFGVNNVSLASIIQKGSDCEQVTILFITHVTQEGNIRNAVSNISGFEEVIGIGNIIRIES